jgi:hypothetical protein
MVQLRNEIACDLDGPRFDKIKVTGMRRDPEPLRLRSGGVNRPAHRDRNDRVVYAVYHLKRRLQVANPA